MRYTRRQMLAEAAAASCAACIPAHAAGLIDPTTPSESMLYCTMRISSKVQGGGYRSGTGFIFSFKAENGDIPVLITNNHVVRDTTDTSFRIHTRSKTEGPPDGNQEITGPGFGSGAWVSHPDKNIDLCGIPLGAALNAMKPTPFYRMLDTALIPTDEQLRGLDAIEEVIMVGYPIGMSDTVNNYPVIRRGVTATDPFVDFEGKSLFVIDIACFPGSSGSPVFLYNAGNYVRKSGGTVIGSRLFLLGVVYATPIYTPEGKVQITEVPTGLQGTVNLQIPINLGYVIKAREINQLGEAIFKQYGILAPTKN